MVSLADSRQAESSKMASLAETGQVKSSKTAFLAEERGIGSGRHCGSIIIHTDMMLDDETDLVLSSPSAAGVWAGLHVMPSYSTKMPT